MTGIADVELGQEAYRAQNWREAYDRLSAARRDGRLDAAGLETLANAAYLTAREEEAAKLWARAHNDLVDRGEIEKAARIGFLLSLTSLLDGRASVSSGWLARTQRLLETLPGIQVEEGFCRIVLGLRELHGGNAAAALETFEGAVALAVEFRDPTLLAVSLLSRGQALLALHRSAEGVECLDEAMVSVTSGAVAPILSGVVYCAVILACQELFDVERAREWTSAFSAWCKPQPDLVPFRGQCMIHRSEILQMRGEWPEALKEAERACRWLSGGSNATVGRAHYQKGEVHRLLGELERADRCYREADRCGLDPQPGRALLRLATGQTEAAVASIRAAFGGRLGAPDSGGRPDRLRLLGPSVEIFLSAGQTGVATKAAEELAAGASELGAPLLEAMSATATATVLAADGKLEAALAMLRTSLGIWQQLGIPYEMARARARLADIAHRLGDGESAAMHGEAARATFRALGAALDLQAIERTPWLRPEEGAAGLTPRQISVLRLVATGQSNREIASALRISEHTVARHVSNIFDRTGASSRAAAVTFAHRNGLLD